MTITEQQPYHTLDGIRGIAATIVMTRHLPDMFGQFIFPRCYLAVDLFFVLSGFVIANAYSLRLLSGMNFGDFMRIRFIRFYPFYVLAFVFAIIALLMEINMADAREWTATGLAFAIGAGLLLLPAPYSPGLALYPLNLPCWSLGFELAVNALYAFIHRRLTTPVLLAVIALSGLGVLRYALYYNGMNYGDGWDGIVAGVARVCFSFFAGIFVWRYRGDRRTHSMGAVLIGLTVAAILLAQIGPMPFDIVMVMAVFPALVWTAARIEPGKSIAPLYINLGLASYGVYVMHTPVGHIIERLAKNAGYTLATPYAGIIFIIALTAAIIWLDKHFDKPMRRMLLRITSRGGN